MPQRFQRLDIPTEALSGYRPVPPNRQSTVTRQWIPSRRLYNPNFPINDPRREIGDNLYYRLKRQADEETKQRLNEAAKIRAARRRQDKKQITRLSQETGLPRPEVQDIRQQLSLYNYTNPTLAFDPQSKEPGGYLANLLEQLGYRPRGAPWAVGDSDGASAVLPNGETFGQWQANRRVA